MTPATAFGLALGPLYLAIAQVESDRGATSKNVYQIRRIYVDDVNRIQKLRDSLDRQAGIVRLEPRRQYLYCETLLPKMAEEMMAIYWAYYGERYRIETGHMPTYRVLARIHNGGPRGWKSDATLGYWRRVKKALDALENRDARVAALDVGASGKKGRTK